MSRQTVNQVIQRAISDAAFRRQLQRDPASALAGFDLTADERGAIASGDPSRLTSLGVDQRMSKAFVIGGMAEASKMVIGDAGGGANAVLVDESGFSGHGALIDDGAAGRGALIDDGAAGATSVLVTGDAARSAVIVGDPTSPTISAIDTVDTTGDMNVLDPGFVSGTTAAIDAEPRGTPDLNQDANWEGIDGGLASAVIVGDPTAPTISAVDPGAALDEAATYDPALIGYDPSASGEAATAFEPASAAGDLNVLDPGAVSGGDAVVDTDLGATTSALDESGGLDTGGDVRPTEY